MRRAYLFGWGLAGFGIAGCFTLDEPGRESFFRKPEIYDGPLNVSPASTEAAARVDTIGRGVLAANPQIGGKPLFRTIGAPQPEVFHRGTTDVFVTEGLVKCCETDGQLAAVLCAELAKMVVERESAAPASVRSPERLPPLNVPVASDGIAGVPDQTHLRELADFEQQKRQKATDRKPPLPDPQALSKSYLRTYLLRAGYSPRDIDSAEPVLQAAAKNYVFERQINASPTSPAAPTDAPPVPGS